MNLIDVKSKYGATEKIPGELIHFKSTDGKTVVLTDGTKVSDALIEAAVKEAAAASKAGSATAEEVVAMLAKLDDIQLDRVAEILGAAQRNRSAKNAAGESGKEDPKGKGKGQ